MANQRACTQTRARADSFSTQAVVQGIYVTNPKSSSPEAPVARVQDKLRHDLRLVQALP